MSERTPFELREEITRVVRKELRSAGRDSWVDAAGAAAHLRMSRYFLHLCREGRGPEGHGVSPRLKRWKFSALDEWMQQRTYRSFETEGHNRSK